MRHGPHHSAQKSNRTGWEDFKTESPKLASVTVRIFSLAMVQEAAGTRKRRLTMVPMAKATVANARPTSIPLTAGAAGRAGAGAGRAGAAGAAGAAGLAGAAGAAAGAAAAGAEAAAGAGAAGAAGAGILMEGPPAGFGGRLIRTVCFLAAASAGFGGSGAGAGAGVGGTGVLGSAIGKFCVATLRRAKNRVKPFIGVNTKKAGERIAGPKSVKPRRGSIALAAVARPLVTAATTAFAAPAAAVSAVAPVTAPATAAAPATTTTVAAIATTAPTAAAPVASSSATPTAETAPAAGRAFFARAGDVDGQGAATQFLAVQHFDGVLGFFGGTELDEGETAGTARELVEHQVDIDHHAGGAEVVLEVAFEGLERQIAHEQPAIVIHTATELCDRSKGRVGTCHRQIADCLGEFRRANRQPTPTPHLCAVAGNCRRKRA